MNIREIASIFLFAAVAAPGVRAADYVAVHFSLVSADPTITFAPGGGPGSPAGVNEAPNDAGLGFALSNYTQGGIIKLGRFRHAAGAWHLIPQSEGSAQVNLAVADTGRALVVVNNFTTVATYLVDESGSTSTLSPPGGVILAGVLNDGRYLALGTGATFYSPDFGTVQGVPGTWNGYGRDGLLYGADPVTPNGTVVRFADGSVSPLPCNPGVFFGGLTQPASGRNCVLSAASANGIVAGQFFAADGRRGIFRFSQAGFEEVVIDPQYWGYMPISAQTAPTNVTGVANDGTVVLAPAYTDTFLQNCKGGPYVVRGSAVTDLKTLIPGGSCFNIAAGISGGGRVFLSSQAQGVNLYLQPTATPPNLFAFVDQLNVPRNVAVTSNAVVVTGLTSAVAISVAGGEYSIGCGGAFVTAPGTIANGQSVCVRHTSAAAPRATVNTVLTIGGVSDTFSSTTAAAVPPMDLNGNGKSDILYRNNGTGQVYRFLADGLALVDGAMAYAEPNTAWKIVADGDFNGDGRTDVIWRNDSTGMVYLMPFGGTALPVGGSVVMTEPNPAWKVVHTPDLDGDGRDDLLWWNSATGQVYAMLMNGAAVVAEGFVYTEPDTAWKIAVTGDFAGSGRRNQLAWRNDVTGQVYLMTVTVSGNTFGQSGQLIYTEPNTAWKIIGAADFSGDGKSDLLWRNEATGQVYLMLMSGPAIAAGAMLHTEANTAWKVATLGDYNGDGRADLLWRNETTGQVYMMLVNGLAIAGEALVYTEGNTAWRVLGPREYGLATGLLADTGPGP